MGLIEQSMIPLNKAINLLCKGETIMGLIEQSMIPLNKAIKAMKLDPSAAAIIAVPEKTTEVHIPVKMDNGKVQVFTGYRCQHSTIMGPAKGFPTAAARAASSWM